jgi:NitT/TauT family transport system substrate-binding protein
MMTSKSTLLICLLALAGTLLTFRPASAQFEKSIIGYPSRSYNVLVLHVAEVKGFFRDEKLEPIVVQMGVGPGILAELNGDVHYYWNFSGPVNGVMTQGMPVKIIAIFNRLLHQAVARPEVRSAADLRGKKFGVSRIEGADHLQAKAILRAKGVDPKDIQFINLAGGDPARVLALKKGLVDAIAVSPPNPYALQKEGYSIIGGPRDLKVSLLASAISTIDQRLRDRPDHVRKVLRALVRSLIFVRENRQETINMMGRWMNENQEIASTSYDVMLPEMSRDGTFSDAEIQYSVDEIKTSIGSNKSISLSQIRDFTLLHQVQKELGLVK